MPTRLIDPLLVLFKMMKLSIVNGEDSSNIEVINLMSNDATRIEHVPFFSSFLIVAPIQTIAVIIILISKIDYSILSGLLVIATIIPIQLLLGRVYNHYKFVVLYFLVKLMNESIFQYLIYSRIKTLNTTDERINLTTEIINGIKVLKMYCWEDAFANIIKKIRMLVYFYFLISLQL